MKCITIIGNIGAQAVLRTTADGRQLMTFNVAVNQNNAEPIWFNCVSNMRDKLFPYLIKGQCVSVVGDLQVSIYNNRPDLTVNVDRIELCGKAPDKDQPTPQTPSAGAAPSFDAANQVTL